MIGTNRYIGSPVERIEDPRFLRGRGQFVGDLKCEGMLHAAILRSPVAHGLLAAVDAGAALAIAGVRAVITAKDIGAVPRIPLRLLPLPGTERFLQPVIAADRVSNCLAVRQATRSTTVSLIASTPGHRRRPSHSSRRYAEGYAIRRRARRRRPQRIALAHEPSANGRAQPLDTGFGHAQFLAAAIGLSRRDREETFAL